MKHQFFTSYAAAALLLVAAICNSIPSKAAADSRFLSAAATTSMQANIGVNAFFSTDKAQKGRMVQAAVVLDIPQGFHVVSNRPLDKYALPTVVRVEAPDGIRVSPVTYPRGSTRRFNFANQLSVYEGRTVMRFNVTVPANYGTGMTQVRVRVRYQSCDDNACYPPVTRDVQMPLAVVGANESVRRINTGFFGGGGGGRRRR
ncbi:MAG: protein-disulfide reductase DsbD domain-containing protein [Pyrinomonadaceae bacterium]